jgi:hypothetical protein
MGTGWPARSEMTFLKPVLRSRADHYPYGEQKGAGPPYNDKDYFTTYRRDETGLDFAWNRYCSPIMGRFTTADPDRGIGVAPCRNRGTGTRMWAGTP